MIGDEAIGDCVRQAQKQNGWKTYHRTDSRKGGFPGSGRMFRAAGPDGRETWENNDVLEGRTRQKPGRSEGRDRVGGVSR